jgi:hypothetical protein
VEDSDADFKHGEREVLPSHKQTFFIVKFTCLAPYRPLSDDLEEYTTGDGLHKIQCYCSMEFVGQLWVCWIRLNSIRTSCEILNS